MVRIEDPTNVFADGDRRSAPRIGELVVLMVIALSVVLLIAASSLRFEVDQVQQVRDGEAVPIHVTAIDNT